MRLVIRRLTETLAFFKSYALSIILLHLMLGLPLVLFYTWWTGRPINQDEAQALELTPFLANLFYEPIYQAALILFIHRKIIGEPFPATLWLGSSLMAYPRLLAVNIARQLPVFALAISFLVLVSPLIATLNPQSPAALPATLVIIGGGVLVGVMALFITARLSLAQFYCIADGLPIVFSLQKSWRNTEPLTGQIIACVIFLFLGIFFILQAIGAILAAIGISGAVPGFVTMIFYLIISSLFTITYYRFYTLAAPAAPLADDPGEPETGEDSDAS
ncbi:MAG: hypothetical protein QMD09_06540 [Desulfatibacillaceae bacterium]|nr:hypothetical protein [Desulfatibacillaceae bacterium]